VPPPGIKQCAASGRVFCCFVVFFFYGTPGLNENIFFGFPKEKAPVNPIGAANTWEWGGFNRPPLRETVWRILFCSREGPTAPKVEKFCCSFCFFLAFFVFPPKTVNGERRKKLNIPVPARIQREKGWGGGTLGTPPPPNFFCGPMVPPPFFLPDAAPGPRGTNFVVIGVSPFKIFRPPPLTKHKRKKKKKTKKRKKKEKKKKREKWPPPGAWGGCFGPQAFFFEGPSFPLFGKKKNPPVF